MSAPFESIRLIEETQNELICRCPFCGDSKNESHGHLYISRRWPVFHCFRCNAQGSIRELEKLLGEKCRISYSRTVVYELPIFNAERVLGDTRDMISTYSPLVSDEEKRYFGSRVGLVSISRSDIVTFSLFPDLISKRIGLFSPGAKCTLENEKSKRVWTMRGLGTMVSGRATDGSVMRYVNAKVDCDWSRFVIADTYFIRSGCCLNPRRNKTPRNLVVAEGIYDIASIYVKRKMYGFDDSSTFFTAVQCSDYTRGIKMFLQLWNNNPENITVFADIDRTAESLRRLFSKCGQEIEVRWPRGKDWCPAGAVACTMKFNEIPRWRGAGCIAKNGRRQ